MTKNEIVAAVGEVIVVVSAALWITRWPFVPYAFAAGTALFVYGRLMMGMRVTALLWLVAAAVLMFFQRTTYLGNGVYVIPSFWIAPFIGFVVNEVYFAFKK